MHSFIILTILKYSYEHVHGIKYWHNQTVRNLLTRLSLLFIFSLWTVPLNTHLYVSLSDPQFFAMGVSSIFILPLSGVVTFPAAVTYICAAVGLTTFTSG